MKIKNDAEIIVNKDEEVRNLIFEKDKQAIHIHIYSILLLLHTTTTL
jgi:hypothetical protein